MSGKKHDGHGPLRCHRDCPAHGAFMAEMHDQMRPAPTPVPSEVAETTAGEREAACGCVIGGLHRYACAGVGHVDPPRTAEPDAGEVESLARVLADLPTDPEHYARLILASDWLAALLDRVRREQGERIAQAIEAEADRGSRVGFGYIGCFTAMTNAAAIARAASVGRDPA